MRKLLLALLIVAGLVSGVAYAQQSYTTQATLAADVTFISRVRVSAVKYAIDNVYVEAGSVALHEERLVLAKKVVNEPDLYARRIAHGIVADLTITENSTDAAIFARLNAVWNIYAQ